MRKTEILEVREVYWYMGYLKNDIHKVTNTDIIIIHPMEHIYTLLWSMKRCLNLNSILIANNTTLTLYTGSEFDLNINRYCENIKIITWDSIDFFSKFCIFTMPTFFSTFNKNQIHYNTQKEIEPTKLFTSLINLRFSRLWRMYIINAFYKYGIIEMGNFTHRMREYSLDNVDFYNVDIKDISTMYPELNTYKKIILDSWTPAPLTMKSDESYDYFVDFQKYCPNEYMECAFDAVIETMYEEFFITEKTIRALDAKKPFFVFGCQYFHKKLNEKYGFLLYDEIIDYNFDKIIKTTERFDAQIEQMRKILVTYSPKDIFKITKEKVDYNYNILKHIRENKIVDIPDEIYQYKDKQEYHYSRKITDNTFTLI